MTLPARDAVRACGSAPVVWANPGIAKIARAKSNRPQSKLDVNVAVLRQYLTGTLLDQIAVLLPELRREGRGQLCCSMDRTSPSHIGCYKKARCLSQFGRLDHN